LRAARANTSVNRRGDKRPVSESSDVLLEESGSVVTIRIDDGKVNAFTEQLLSSLSEALEFAVARDRVALILGRDGCLSAGFNLSTMRGDADDRKNLVLAGLELALKVFESPVPVVVGCTGHAIAAGTLLLMTADHVIVGDGPVKIGLNETTIGIELSPFVLELARYRLLPSAYNQILQGNLYDAKAAQLAGYVDEVVASPDLYPCSIEVANRLASFDLVSYRRTKAAMRSTTTSALRAALARKRSE
jgi:enoyl-CoA hydratase